MTTNETTKKCYDCDGPLPSREERKAGAKHECVPLTEPAPGTSYALETFDRDTTGMIGSYGVDILNAAGETIAGLLHSRSGCERLLRIRGFKGPFNWPTVAQSKAARAARRAKFAKANETLKQTARGLTGATKVSAAKRAAKAKHGGPVIYTTGERDAILAEAREITLKEGGPTLEQMIAAVRLCQESNVIKDRCVRIFSPTGKALALVDARLHFDSHPHIGR